MLGQELINELKGQTQKVDEDIQGIKDEINKINEQLKEHEGYDVDSIKARKGLEADKKLFEESLHKAKEHKTSLIADNTKDTVNRGLKIVKDYRKQLNDEVAEDNERVGEMVEEIHTIYNRTKDKDDEAKKNIKAFVKEVKKYTDPTPVNAAQRFGDPQPRIDLLERETENLKDYQNHFVNVEGFKEHQYDIEGLYPPHRSRR